MGNIIDFFLEIVVNYLDFFLEMDLILQIVTLASVFWIPAGFVAIRNYRRIGSLDYLIFAGWFFTNGLGFLSGSFLNWFLIEHGTIDPIFLFLSYLNQLIMLFFVTAHPLRLRWQWKNKPTILWIILGLFLGVLLAYLTIMTIFPDSLQFEIFMFIFWLAAFFYATVWLFAYFTFRPAYPDTRVKMVIIAWIYIGLVDLIQSIVYIVTFILGFLSLPTIDFTIISDFVYRYLTIPYVSVVFLVGVLLPEAMIISEAQILRAHKLYQTVRHHNCEPHIVDQDRLLSYMCKVSEEVFPSQSR
ncbi:MAG: hypothetical protein ACFE8U_12620 [Candidatus Hermodarchaeota archaeon]